MASTKEYKSRMAPETVKLLKKHNIGLHPMTQYEDKYSMQRFINCSAGFEFLQNLFYARNYVQKKYNVDLYCLELLLQLYPMQVFSQADFSPLAKMFRYRTIKSLIRYEVVVLVQDSKRAEERLYGLSIKGKSAVRMLYKVLSGEVKYSEFKHRNPVSDKESSAFDKKKFQIMKKINQQPPNEKLKVLYE